MNHEFWYLSRAAGFTAYLLLFVSVALGIGMGTRLVDRFVRRNLAFDLHRFTTILALVFTVFHVYILLLDGYFNFTVWQLSIPFLSPYRGWQTAVGIAAMYAMVLVIISFYVRRYIGYRMWRALHYLTFGLFAAAALHGITAGTDTTQLWAKVTYLVTAAGVLGLIAYRLQYRVPDSPTVRTLRLVAASATIIFSIVLVFGSGLLAPGKSPGASASAGHPFLPSFTNDFSGTFAQTRSTSDSHLVVDGTATGDVPARLHIELDQTTAGQSGSSVTLNKAQLLDARSNDVICDGRLTSLSGGVMRLTCTGVGPYEGVQMSISSTVQTASDGTLSGALTGTMSHG